MSTLYTADLHLTDNPRDEYRFKFLETTLPYLVKKYEVIQINILGDITESKDRHPARLVNRISTGFARVAQMAQIHELMGNHDYAAEGHPFFQFLHHIPGISFFAQPHHAGTIMYLPHTRNPERDWKGLSFERCKRILCHQSFAGAKGAYEGVSPSLLPDLPIFAGDIHIPQKFGRITYVGAPYTVDFGDDYEPRVLVHLPSGRRLTVRVPGPQKRVVRWSKETEVNAGDIVRYEIPIKRSQYTSWQTFVDRARKWADEQGVVLESVVPIIIDKDTRPIKRKVAAAVSDEHVLDEYARRHKLDERTAKVGKELL